MNVKPAASRGRHFTVTDEGVTAQSSPTSLVSSTNVLNKVGHV